MSDTEAMQVRLDEYDEALWAARQEREEARADRDALADALRAVRDKQRYTSDLVDWERVAAWMADTADEALAEMEEGD